jgi:intracellular sulfur oxidation DsrE/DsrF family protein
MRIFLASLLLLVLVSPAYSQSANFKIVFDLASQDTADHSAVLRQFNNVLKEAPDAELEVVCHGPAVWMLVAEKAFFQQRMAELMQKGHVSFRICANSMRRFGIDRSQLLPFAEVVPVAILELADKQQKGWSYIRAGH